MSVSEFCYKKISVIGNSGAGKSTFSRKLQEKTGLPLYHLDNIWWRSDWTHIRRRKFVHIQNKIMKQECWIIDGNFMSTIEKRIKNSDLVYFFDLPFEICIDGYLERFGKKREDCPGIETEIDYEFIEYIKNFNRHCKPIILDLFEKYNTSVITFKSRKEIDDYLKRI